MLKIPYNYDASGSMTHYFELLSNGNIFWHFETEVNVSKSIDENTNRIIKVEAENGPSIETGSNMGEIVDVFSDYNVLYFIENAQGGYEIVCENNYEPNEH